MLPILVRGVTRCRHLGEVAVSVPSQKFVGADLGGKVRNSGPGPGQSVPFRARLHCALRLPVQGNLRAGPGRKDLHQRPEYDEGQDQKDPRHRKPFDPQQLHLIDRQAPEALGKELPPDHHVPADAEDSDLDQHCGAEVDHPPELR